MDSFISNSSRIVVPAGAQCFVGSLQATNPVTSCPVTADMVQFLNLTDHFEDYFVAYCLKPPQGDGCPYGYCPNLDVAGLFVRIAAYLTNFFVAILVFYKPEDLKDTFWSQLLSIYALLLTCAWTLIRQQLTRIHAILALATAGSPLTVCIFVYAIRSIWETDHRLSPAVGKGRLFPRSIVLIAMGFWIGLFIYVTLPSHLSSFQQESCEQGNNVVKYFFALPLLLFVDMPVWSQVLAASPFLFTIIAWVVAIVLRRQEIWPQGKSYRPHFLDVWRVTENHYPFIQFVTVIAIPTAYWIAAIESGIRTATSRDNTVIATFGQVLAMFVAVPPMLEVIELCPRVLAWFSNLCWVRFITRRRQRGQGPELPEPEPAFSYSFPSGSRDSGLSDNKLKSIIPLAVSWPSNGRKRSLLGA